MLATPDYIACVPTGEGFDIEPVECKTDQGGEWGDPRADDPEVPKHHWMQVVQQACILGATRGHLVRWANGKLTTYVIPVGDDERRRFAEWAGRAEHFLWTIDHDIVPPVDDHAATAEALKSIFAGHEPGKSVSVSVETIARFNYANTVYADAKRKRELARNRLRLEMGDAEFATNPETGEKVARRMVYKRRGYEVAPAVIDQVRQIKTTTKEQEGAS
jgi:hypothetical protein